MKSWNTTDAHAMARIIIGSGIALDRDDSRLVIRADAEPEATFNVYDLHRLNLLCWLSEGFVRGRESVESPARVVVPKRVAKTIRESLEYVGSTSGGRYDRYTKALAWLDAQEVES